MIEIRDGIERITRDATIKQMIALSPEILLILKTAALFTDARNRWQMYEDLKRRASSLVGFDARNPELRTCECYEAMMKAIDSLLPDEYGG